MLIECLLLIFLLLSIYYWRATTYWQRKGVFSPPGEFFFGHIRKIIFFKISLQDFFDELYQKHKDKKLIGFYNFCEPMLLVTDLEYINQIFVSDFNSFSAQQLVPSKRKEPLMSYNPFLSSGEVWKSRRTLHASQQTIAKLKEGLPSMAKNTQMMVDYIKDQKSKPVVIEDFAKYYTMDNASSFFYGYEPNAFKDPENAFRKYGYNILQEDSSGIYPVASTVLPILKYIFTVRLTTKELDDFFIGMAPQILDLRKKNNITRNDLIGQLVKIDERLKAEGKPGLDPEEIAGHCYTAYIDSVETSSAILTFLLLELANRQDFQERLREEIKSVGTKIEDFDFEKVHSIKYLTMVLNEVFRIYPLLFYFQRLCTKTTKLGDVVIDKGTKIFIPYSSIINDPEYFPAPERFDPERFSEESKKTFVKGTFFPFGEGPRQCLGMKYALLQLKMGVIALLLNFNVLPTTKVEEDKKVENAKDNTFFQIPEKDLTLIFESL